MTISINSLNDHSEYKLLSHKVVMNKMNLMARSNGTLSRTNFTKLSVYVPSIYCS